MDKMVMIGGVPRKETFPGNKGAFNTIADSRFKGRPNSLERVALFDAETELCAENPGYRRREVSVIVTY